MTPQRDGRSVGERTGAGDTLEAARQLARPVCGGSNRMRGEREPTAAPSPHALGAERRRNRNVGRLRVAAFLSRVPLN
jgi:hypothetical protein